MKRVLVTNAGGRLGISVTRALKAAPDPCYVIGADAHEVQLHRAISNEKHLLPRADEPDYLPVLQSIIQDTRPDFLWLNHEGEIAQVSRIAQTIGVKTFLPSHDTVTLCQNKLALSQRLQEAGVPSPRSVPIQTPKDLTRAFSQLGPQLWLRSIKGSGGKGSLPASDFQTATRWIDLHNGWGRFMAAPRLTGDTVTWESVWDRGELMAAQVRRRLFWDFTSLTFSGVTGVGGGHRWVKDPVVSQVGMQAIKAVDPEPHGILGVDMTSDSQGMPQVTEINAGRFLMCGGIVCFITPEYNLAYLIVQTALGEKPTNGLSLVDRIPHDTVVVHGMDMEPIIMPFQEVQPYTDELLRRRAAVASDSTIPVTK